jgi:hypothetical protein
VAVWIRRALPELLVILVLTSFPARGAVFDAGPVDGILDLTFAYGLMVRTQERDLDFVGIANGGRAESVNFDDGSLNYDRGVFANELRLSADLTLGWRNFGFFIRGFGFYDFETQLNDRERTDLSHDARRLVGSGGNLQEYYFSAQFAPAGVPFQLRVGDQIINWGSGGFLRFGADVVNPLDLVSLTSPTASARDIFVPQGMVWLGVNVSELVAVEAFYQYDWEPVIDPPVGHFFSADDLIGGDGTNKYVTYFTEGGEFSDLGTHLEQFGGPPGSFDPNFMRVPSAGKNDPRDQGQYGFTLRMLLPSWNTSSLRVHFINYHSRLPIISGIAANQAAIDDAANAATGSENDRTLALGRLSNATHYGVDYPEDIKMLGLSFDSVLPYTGTLAGIEISHHFNWPVQKAPDEVIEAALSPLRNSLNGDPPGPVGANQVVSGLDETHKTQVALELLQEFGPALGWVNSLLALNVGWVHFDDLKEDDLFDEDSFGYSIFASVTYSGVFGGLTLEPFLAFTHDFSGFTPGPAGAFLEDRKSLSAGVSANFTNTITANLSYVSFFGGKPLNASVDRDFLSFNIRYHY